MTKLAYSADGAILATVGSDHTVFFFSVTSPVTYEPLGFVRVGSAINSLVLGERQGARTALLALENGNVAEYVAPKVWRECFHFFLFLKCCMSVCCVCLFVCLFVAIGLLNATIFCSLVNTTRRAALSWRLHPEFTRWRASRNRWSQ